MAMVLLLPKYVKSVEINTEKLTNNPFADIDDPKEEPAYVGGTKYSNCQLKSHKKWDEVSERPYSMLEQFLKPGWKRFAKNTIQEDNFVQCLRKMERNIGKMKDLDEDEKDERKDIQSNINEKAERILTFHLPKFQKYAELQLMTNRNCMAMATMTHFVDYSKEHSADKKTQSFDGKIKCVGYGAETQDYPACAKAVIAYNAAFIGQKGLETFQTIKIQDDMNDAQMDIMKNASTNPGEMTKNSLELQKKGIEEQKKVTEQRAVFHSAKAAALVAINNSFPTATTLLRSCKEGGKLNGQNAGMEDYNVYMERLEMIAKKVVSASTDKSHKGFSIKRKVIGTDASICESAMRNGGFRLLLNQNAKSALKEIMLTAGIDMGANLMKANLLGKQANRMEDAISSIDKFIPEDHPLVEQSEAFVRYCEAHPEDPKCSMFSIPGQDVNNMEGGFSFDGGSGQATQIGDQNTDGNVVDTDGGIAPTGGLPETRSAFERTGIEKPSGFSDPNIASATEKDAGGGGGGGGGSVGGTAGGLGASSSDPSASGASAAATKKSYSPKYSDGGKFSGFRYLGGKGEKSKSGKNNNNPFADLFGKKKSTQTGSIKFGSRSIASKSNSIWDLISNGYQKADKSDRLMKYKIIMEKDEQGL